MPPEVEYYNQRRPHRSLNRRTPQQAFDAIGKARPEGIVSDVHYRIRLDQIDDNGTVTLRYKSKLHHIGVGRKHRNKRVVVLVADRNIRVVNLETGELLRSLILDPTRNYQRRDPV